ncbi:MAG: entericidin A/B family lipoprotein [Geminicoccaceae bacterium]|nr:entericidin A/B family lipoprotein [Geminicoccaceae bacterium]
MWFHLIQVYSSLGAVTASGTRCAGPALAQLDQIKRGLAMKLRTIDPLREEITRYGSILALFVGLFMILALAGCNTMEGLGEDTSAAGEAMSDTADDVEDDL